MKDNVIEHLKFIQETINRMARNSFAIKGWTSALNIAIFAFAGTDKYKAVIISIIPTILFWILDSYYLLQEKKYRLLYDNVRLKDKADFDMNCNNLDIKLKDVKSYRIINSFFSFSELFFYIGFIIAIIIVYIYPFK